MSNRKAQRATALFKTGLGEFQQGRGVVARRFCEQALEISPRNADALHLLGVIALQGGDPAAALGPLQQAMALRPDHPACQANVAYAYVGLKRYAEAATAFERAARLDAGNPELEVGLGNCLGLLGKPSEAEAVFRRLVARHPGHALGWFNLANALKDQERYQEAHDLYLRVTQLAPQFAEAYCNLGIALHKMKQYEPAEQAFRAGLARNPAFVPAHVSLAITLNSLRRHAEAEALCREALAREPRQKNAWPVLGKALLGLGRWHDALQCYERAVTEYPDSSDAWGDLGDALRHVGRMEEALAAFDRAYALGNISPLVRFLKATTLFSVGRFAEGAAEYRGRQERVAFVEQYPGRALATDLPAGLGGLDICLLGEQGIGDELFFLRYAPLLKARGGRITYYGNPRISGMLARGGALDRVLPGNSPYAAADYTMLAGDLPHLLAPPELPPPLALSPLPERVAAARERLRQLGPPPYIGLTWRAGTGPQEQRGHVWFLFKQAPLENFAAALGGVKATLVSLQRRPQAGETEKLGALLGKPLHDLSAANEDLEEMLALLAVMDEYVGVSNTNMHLRAGIGKTARVLLPWPAEWRWMAAGAASPWFPGFRVYRQQQNGDWNEALARLSGELAAAAR